MTARYPDGDRAACLRMAVSTGSLNETCERMSSLLGEGIRCRPGFVTQIPAYHEYPQSGAADPSLRPIASRESVTVMPARYLMLT